MTELYVISECYYIEDYYRAYDPVAVAETREAAETKVEQLKAEFKVEFNYCNKIRQFKNEWRDANDYPTCGKLHYAPRWPAGLGKHQITDEMKEERANVGKLNEPIIAAHNKACEAYLKKFSEAIESFILENNIPEKYADIAEQYSSKYFYSDLEFIINPVPKV